MLSISTALLQLEVTGCFADCCRSGSVPSVCQHNADTGIYMSLNICKRVGGLLYVLFLNYVWFVDKRGGFGETAAESVSLSVSAESMNRTF